MPYNAEQLLKAIENTADREIRLMEVCGTHTMAIARSGIRSLLPKNVKLLSGPGCPVCVTPPEVIDPVLELAMRPGVRIATYGDMMRVPGSVPGDNLQRRKALGAAVDVVYSPIDAVKLAEDDPQSEIVFLGVGFETTAPGTAASVVTAAEKGLRNYSVLSMLKTVEPSLRALMASEDFRVDGFLCPGHVATIIGERGFRFLTDEYHIPGVIAGFEPEDILLAVFLLTKQLSEGKAELRNEYRRAVAPEGNPLARAMLERVFEPCTVSWRGLGVIENSGLRLRKEYGAWDAAEKFGLQQLPPAKPTACRCGDVITGRLEPQRCPFFGTRCVPEDPVGPCMVSSEGACAAAYKYQMIE